MQDNRKQEYSLEDRGWRRMAELLDREMPKKDRRRGMLWWTTALGLLLAVAVWGYYSLTPVSHTDAPIERIQQQAQEQISPVADIEINNKDVANAGDKNTVSDAVVEREIASSGRQQIEAAAAVESAGEVSNLRREAVLSVRKDQISILNTGLVEDQSNSGFQEGITSISVKQPDNSEMEVVLSPASDELGESEIEQVTGIVELESKENSSYELRNTEALSGLSSPMIAGLQTPGIDIAQNRIKPAKRKSGFELQALAAVHSDFGTAPIYGAEAGVAAVFRSARRIRIRSGVSYGYYNVDGVPLFGLSKNRDLESIDLGTNPGSQYDPLYDQMDILTNQIEFTAAEQLTKQFHYLHMPVAVEYSFLPRWAVMVGARFSYLTSAPARYEFNDPVFFTGNFGSFSSTKSFLYDYEVLRKFDVAPEVGLSFKAS